MYLYKLRTSDLSLKEQVEHALGQDDLASFKFLLLVKACEYKELRFHKHHNAHFWRTQFQDVAEDEDGYTLYYDFEFEDKLTEYLKAPCNILSLVNFVAVYRETKDKRKRYCMVKDVAKDIEKQISGSDYDRAKYQRRT